MRPNTPDIIIGIPTLNEEDSIGRTAETIDAGLLPYRQRGMRTLILNLDSGSADSTVSVFSATPLCSPKASIPTGENGQGKGRCVLALLDEGVKADARVIVTIDADITTLAPEWIGNLVEPVLSDNADYVSPLYRRNRFEGSTTNHFAFPLIYALFGKAVRQPIGGEFAMRTDVARYLLEQAATREVEGYGIDIFMTLHAIGRHCRVSQALLGQKLHKPSFPKIAGMFQEVSVAAFQTLGGYQTERGSADTLVSGAANGIDERMSFPHKEKAFELVASLLPAFEHDRSAYELVMPKRLAPCNTVMHERNIPLDKDLWTDILAGFIRHARATDVEGKRELARLLTPLFLKRALSFWLAAENMTAVETEACVLEGASLLREKCLID